ncbi:hypothetical protein DPMN_099965 [Dreissena polymorpha]|uniref:Uncharacterized protein n=1 Tax=Dreissena polymorpha TaxID=45954 RepID=A0A9D4LGL9_DREPO|nr:hypothetical protein DPMN_099965 [Dreissena polymorpha]
MIGQKLKTAPPTGGHTNILTNFELGRDFIGTKLLTKFHEDGTRNVAFRDGRTYDGQTPVIKAYLSNQLANSRETGLGKLPPEDEHKPFAHLRGVSSFNLYQMSNITKILLSKHPGQVSSLLNQNSGAWSVFIFVRFDQDFIGTKLLTKFHEDRTINVASRVFTNKCGRTDRRWT